MTPIPPDVAAAIVAAGHCLRVEPDAVGFPAWQWGDGPTRSPRWRVRVGELRYMDGASGCASAATPRRGLLAALEFLAQHFDRRAAKVRDTATRRRDPSRKASDEREAVAATQVAADARALAAQVAAMWPDPAAVAPRSACRGLCNGDGSTNDCSCPPEVQP